jgi:hypothetical protein
MIRAVAGVFLAPAIVVVAWPCPACAQSPDVLDNMMLLGRAETLRLPGVQEVEERPEEKAPPALHARMLEESAFHRPLESHLHPVEAYALGSRGFVGKLNQSSSGGAVQSATSALFKPGVRISRTRPARTRSPRGMH